ncbi:MAG: hypothetical protein H5U20_03145 [Rhodobacteraceae bacterium]|nr:hypothetical protein [Paracoccaceae bacterium]
MSGRHEALAAYLRAARGRPFQAGKHDCFLFAAGACRAIGGPDLGRGWRGKYRSVKRGLALARAAGYADHVDFVARHLPEKPVATAQVGDLVALRFGDEWALGVCVGARVQFLHERGLGSLPLTAAARAFGVA